MIVEMHPLKLAIQVTAYSQQTVVVDARSEQAACHGNQLMSKPQHQCHNPQADDAANRIIRQRRQKEAVHPAVQGRRSESGIYQHRQRPGLQQSESGRAGGEKQEQKDQKDQKDQESKQDQQQKQEKKDQQQEQQQQKPGDKQEQSQEKKPGEEGKDSKEQKEGGNAAQQLLQMTPEQAQRLLEAVKSDEKVMIFTPQVRTNRNNRTLKDW